MPAGDVEDGVDIPIEPQSLQTLFATSFKRTYAMFLGNYGQIPSQHLDSARMLLQTKVNDEYAAVKDLPPPAPAAPQGQSQPTSERARKVQRTEDRTSASDKINRLDGQGVAGHNPFPMGPGVQLTPETAVTHEPTSSQIEKLIDTLPDTKAMEEARKVSTIVAYRGPAGIPEKFRAQSSALAIRTPQVIRPEWHAPWKLYKVIQGHLGWVRALAVDPANEWFVSGSADRTIKIFDLATCKLKLTLTGHINTVRGLAVSSRHPYLFSCGEDKTVKCWDLEQNKVIRSYHGHLSGVYCMSLHPTLDVLITGGRDSCARVWDIRTKNSIHVMGGHSSTVDSVLSQSLDPQVITGSMDATVKLWDLAAGKCMATLTNHKKSIRAMVNHHNEYTFATGAADNIKIWKCPEGKFLRNLSGHNSIVNAMALNKDNVLVSCADNGSMYFWDWKSGYNFQRMETIAQPGSLDSEAGIFCAAFDQSSSRLITGECDKTIKIWREDENATPESHPIDFRPDQDPLKNRF